MLARIRAITVDCHDPHRLARFWAEVLGYVDDPEDPNRPGDPETLLIDPKRQQPALQFIPVPERKTVKNRVHLDLQALRGRDDTVELVLAAGGTLVADHRRPDGTGWVTLADPEGNELCVERSAAERGTPPPVDTGIRRMLERTADERTMLTAMLDWYRDGVVHKVAGLRDDLAGVQPFRTETSIGGLVKHLAIVEDGWFTRSFAGHDNPWGHVDWDNDPNWEFRTGAEEPLAASIALYEAACERSRAVTAAHQLDDLGADTGRLPFSLRFVLLHLIEETARHLGHLDLIREAIDGQTGH